MQESLHGYMKVGLVHFMAFPECMRGGGPILETVETLVKDPFFEVLEISRIKDIRVRRQVQAVAEQARVQLCFGAQPVLLAGDLNLNHPESEERERAIDALYPCIDEARILGIRSMAVLSGKNAEDGAQARAWLVDSLKEVCRRGREKHVRIVLETFDQVSFGKNCLIGPTADAVAVSRAVREEFPDFGLMLDLSHLPLQGEKARDAVRMAGEHLVHVHIGNCAMDDPRHPAYGDNHPRFGTEGTRNDVPELAKFLRVLLDSGYLKRKEREIVSFEVKPMGGEDPWDVIAGSKRTLEEAWRQV